MDIQLTSGSLYAVTGCNPCYNGMDIQSAINTVTGARLL